ncbi:MAG: hypothetical protein Kow00121_50180 [Elainellaceae cyanobacterium]
MEEHQQELRQAAAKAFMDSLEELGRSLQPCQEAPKAQPPAAKPPCPAPIQVEELEEASADIEQFMQSRDSLG